MLWGVVLLWLICPFSLSGNFSLIPISVQTVPQDMMYQQNPQINSGVGIIDQAINHLLPTPAIVSSVNPLQIWIALGAVVWLIDILILIVYSAFTAIRLKTKLKLARHIADNIYEMNLLKTPFVFGFFRPQIYLPAQLSENEKAYILSHEQAHIKRFDHIIKPFAFLVLCIYWFNPLVWVRFSSWERIWSFPAMK